MKEDYVVSINETENNKKPNKVSKILRYISLFLAILPIVLILYCVIASHGEGEDGAGAIMWLVIIYYWSIGLPIAIASIITGIVSFLKEKNLLSIISLVLAVLPFIVYFFFAL